MRGPHPLSLRAFRLRRDFGGQVGALPSPSRERASDSSAEAGEADEEARERGPAGASREANGEADELLVEFKQMERIVKIHVERLPEGVYLATTTDLQGLVAQGRTAAEALEIARDVARRLLEAQAERKQSVPLPSADETFETTLIVGS